MRRAEGDCHRSAIPDGIDETVVSCIAIDLQNAEKSLEQFLGAFTLAILGEDISDRRRRGTAPRPIVRGDCP
jgi:hypothetical protein